MAPTIHFVRHAQGYHNLSVANHEMPDPLLTPFGEQQCAHLQSTFPYTATVEAVVASPLKRTIYTALLSCPVLISRRRLNVIALPELQETSDLPCDTGSSRSQLEHEFAGKPVDLTRVVDGWNSKKGKWAPDATSIEQRCTAARKWLRARPEAEIVVVTHGGVLHYLTEDWTGSEKFVGTGWANTEFRSYTFKSADDESASLQETDESLARRRGFKKPLSEAEQRNLKSAATKDWEKSGYQKPGQSTGIPSKWRTSQTIMRPSSSSSRATERDWIGAFGV